MYNTDTFLPTLSGPHFLRYNTKVSHHTPFYIFHLPLALSAIINQQFGASQSEFFVPPINQILSACASHQRSSSALLPTVAVNSNLS
jgi:hypothetical protein